MFIVLFSNACKCTCTWSSAMLTYAQSPKCLSGNGFASLKSPMFYTIPSPMIVECVRRKEIIATIGVSLQPDILRPLDGSAVVVVASSVCLLFQNYMYTAFMCEPV